MKSFSIPSVDLILIQDLNVAWNSVDQAGPESTYFLLTVLKLKVWATMPGHTYSPLKSTLLLTLLRLIKHLCR